MPKPPTKGASDGVSLPKPAVPCITRSGTLTAASSKTISEPNEAASKDQQPILTIDEGAVEALAPARKDFATSITTLQPIVEALNKILVGNSSSIDIIKGIFRYIKELEAAERDNRDRIEIQAEVSSFRKAFRNNLSQMHDDIKHQLNGITTTLNVTLETTEKAPQGCGRDQG